MTRIQNGELNPMWKGDNVSYRSLHKWVRRHLPNHGKCWDCNKKTKFLDAANISGQYKRDLSDWKYSCRSCHMKSDGRLDKFKKMRCAGGWNKGSKTFTKNFKRDSTGKFINASLI